MPTPTIVLCRRVADFPEGQIPAGGAVTPCAECGALVVFDPHSPYAPVPKVCQQCRAIPPQPVTEPLTYPPGTIEKLARLKR
jgi:hypothetical protein